VTEDQGTRPPDANRGSHPLIRVTRGQPTPEDIAALSAVVSAILARRSRAAAGAEARRHSPTRPGWPDRPAQLRAPLVTGPDAWRRSAHPR
jgi:Acyl-CoA carboxylase epsilon subunit